MTLEHHVCALCGDDAPWDRWTLPPRRRRGLVLRFCSSACLDEWEYGEAEVKDKEPERMGPGRPRIELTAAMIDTADRLFHQGHSISTIAQAIGVSRTTAYRWISEGEKAEQDGDESEYGIHLRLFWDAHIKGRVNTKKKVLKNIIDASEKDWRAGQWYLSVTEPQDYSEKVVTARALHELGINIEKEDAEPVKPGEIRPEMDAPPPIIKDDT